MEQELRVLYWKTLQREPSFLEKSNHLNNLISGFMNIDDVKVVLEESGEYKNLQSDYGGEVSYDRTSYTIELTNANENNYDGVNLSNGKICVKTSSKPYETELSVITTNYEFNSLGRYNNNIANAFTFTNVKFFSMDYDTISITDMKQSLNMYTATFSMTYTIQYAISGVVLNLTHEWMALQQYPYCFLQTFSIENGSVNDIDLDMYHILSCGDNLSNVEYYNNTVDGLKTFSGKGFDKEKGITMATNSAYLFEDVEMRVQGLGIVNESTSYNKLSVNVVANGTTKFNIVSGVMSSSDFVDPPRELLRILQNIKNKQLKVEHNQQWINIWKTADIVLSQKTNIEADELDLANEEMEVFQKHLKYSLFNVFSIVRDDVNVDVNTLNLSAVDLTGEIFWNAEMFLIPVLLLLRPKCAGVLLDFRYKQLQNARNLALAYGHKGSQYPYKEDVVHYNDMYWTSGTPVYAFNTGLIAISAWNYYRVTLDKYWLHEKGFPILQNCARFFQSLFDEDLNLIAVYTMNNLVEENNALTKYLAIHVLKNYREACFELSFNIPPDINDLYNSVRNEVVSLTNTINANTSTMLPQNVTIKTENNDITLYNTDTMELIGSRYGGHSGNYLKLDSLVDYVFTVDKNTYVKLYDVMNVEISEFDGTAKYSTKYGLTDGTVYILAGNVSSYSNLYLKDYVFGKNAFVGTVDKPFHNIIETQSENTVLESHFILMTYYSTMFFNTNNSLNKSDIIQDNLMYYNLTNVNSDSFINKFIKANLEGLLAQDVGLNTAKEYYINKFDSTMKSIFNSPEISKPWGNHDYHAFMIFNFLTSIIKLRIKGTISDQRFYTDTFGIDSRTGYILPKYWNKATVIYNKTELIVANEY
uniref:Glycoside hydrolase family 65 central catalytic domain-containing protein n=1 Tax=Pyramimonas orientalis virus TaxID=455367 RepID=A0A7L9AXQ8_POV01|nr:hypothetical protein HWQ62_00262 [Pyramimonas orientalis virus]